MFTTDYTLTTTIGDPVDGVTIYPPNGRQFGQWSYLIPPYIPQEPVMKLTAEKYAVVSRVTGQVVEVHDSEKAALNAAKRLAAKEQDEFWVFGRRVTVRPKPVDLDVEYSEPR